MSAFLIFFIALVETTEANTIAVDSFLLGFWVFSHTRKRIYPSMSRHPEVKWAQRTDKVYLTILLPDAKDAKVNLEEDGVFSFSATAGSDNHIYELKLDLFDKVNAEESKINIGVRVVFCVVVKAEKVWWKKLLRGDGKLPQYVKVDWDKWVEEDDEPGSSDLGGMYISKKLGGMKGMGDMGDVLGDDLGDDLGDEVGDDLGDDLEDEEEEAEKAEEAPQEAAKEATASA
ncbi:uncharacterized protein OsI_027940-like [Aristolochia californica]|uniref:uncharacterized protein OsI_027940-like n=1 Tax=Aristolochia californica TaxID=171875 RepID=UPI0035E15190